MLTGLYSYGQAAGLTHAYAAVLSGTVDPIHNAPPSHGEPPRAAATPSSASPPADANLGTEKDTKN